MLINWGGEAQRVLRFEFRDSEAQGCGLNHYATVSRNPLIIKTIGGARVFFFFFNYMDAGNQGQLFRKR